MQIPALDHIVITASSLEDGAAYVENLLGVSLMPEGKHPGMATHNRVLNLGNGVYLEVIAVDPDAEMPLWPRWFAFESGEMKRRIAEKPVLATWVVRTDDIEDSQAKSREHHGNIRPMKRGNFLWEFLFTKDGTLHWDGILPCLISWKTPHPTDTMPDSGCRLKSLSATHPYAEYVQEVLQRIGVADSITLTKGEKFSLRAVISCPKGDVVIES